MPSSRSALCSGCIVWRGTRRYDTFQSDFPSDFFFSFERYLRHTGTVFEPERRRLLLLATAMQPIARLQYPDKKAKGRPATVSGFIVKDRLKVGTPADLSTCIV